MKMKSERCLAQDAFQTSWLVMHTLFFSPILAIYIGHHWSAWIHKMPRVQRVVFLLLNWAPEVSWVSLVRWKRSKIRAAICCLVHVWRSVNVFKCIQSIFKPQVATSSGNSCQLQVWDHFFVTATSYRSIWCRAGPAPKILQRDDLGRKPLIDSLAIDPELLQASHVGYQKLESSNLKLFSIKIAIGVWKLHVHHWFWHCGNGRWHSRFFLVWIKQRQNL